MYHAIINGFHEPYNEHVVGDLIKTLSIQYCEYIGTERSLRLPGKSKHHYFGGISWGWYDVDWNEIMPLDSKIVSESRECETIVLKMMDRLEPMRHLDYSDRKRIYLRHLRYWHDAIERHGISLFISSNIPHENYDYVIYFLCKKKEIKTVLLHQGPIRDTFFAFRDWEKFVEEIHDKYNELRKDKETSDRVVLSSRFEEHFRVMRSGEKNPVLFYMEDKEKKDASEAADVLRGWVRPRFGLIKFAKVGVRFVLGFLVKGESNNIFRISNALSSWSERITRERLKQEIVLFYVKKSSAPDLARKYVYFPLHFQPELTSSPLGGVFVDQIIIAELLNAALPEEISIFVKEHPKQNSLGRDIAFYEDLLNVRKVKLIDKEFDSRRLIKHSLAVATISGTAGWEALFLQKPVLMFGSFFYQYADGVYRIRTLQDCKRAINRIIVSEKRPVLADMRVFLKAVEICAHVGYVDGAYAGISMITEKKCTGSILSAIRRVVES